MKYEKRSRNDSKWLIINNCKNTIIIIKSLDVDGNSVKDWEPTYGVKFRVWVDGIDGVYLIRLQSTGKQGVWLLTCVKSLDRSVR